MKSTTKSSSGETAGVGRTTRADPTSCFSALKRVLKRLAISERPPRDFPIRTSAAFTANFFENLCWVYTGRRLKRVAIIFLTN